jgi:hypothetical protein
MAGALILLLTVATERPSVAGQDELQRLLEAFSMDIPVRSMVAPAFTLPGLDGTRVRLDRLQSRLVMLYFWTTW